MANRWAIATGNKSNPAIWDGGLTVPGSGDSVCANGFTVTIDSDWTVALVTTAAVGSGAAGGGFVLSSGVVLTASVQAGSTDCITFASGTSTIVGTITGSATTNTTNSILHSGSGTLNITGDVYGGASTSARLGLKMTGSGTANITGTVGRVSSTMNSTAVQINSTSVCTINVTGSVQGGTLNQAWGIDVLGSSSTGHVISVSGNVTGGTNASCYGIQSAVLSSFTIGGNVSAGSVAGSVVNGMIVSVSTINITVAGSVYGNNFGVGLVSSASGTIKIYGNADASGSTSAANAALSASGTATYTWVVGNAIAGTASPLAAGIINTSLSGGCRLDGNMVGNAVAQALRVTSPMYVYDYTDNTAIFPLSTPLSVGPAGTSVTIYGAAAGGSGQASQADVRHGTVYGPSSELTGTCYVPGAASVLYGVNVDATVGTAIVGNPAVLVNTTIATLSSQTSFTLTVGSADNDAYNNLTAVITDASTANQKCVGTVSDYVGSTKTITLLADPGVFTVSAGDSISIIAGGGGSTAPTVTEIRQEMDSNSTKLAILSNGTYGNSALNTDLDTLLTKLVGTIAAGTHNPQSGDAYSVVSNGTYGNAALKTLIDAVGTIVTTISGIVGSVTYGNSALKTLIDAIKTKTDSLTFTNAGKVDASLQNSADYTKLADILLRRGMAAARASANGDTVSQRSLLGALSKLVNKVDAGQTDVGKLTITEEDDTTTFYQQDITTDADAEPIVQVD